MKKYRKYALFFCDFIIWNLSFYISYAINKNCLTFVSVDERFFEYLAIMNICFIAMFLAFKLYDKIWRYADVEDFFYAGLATLCANFMFFVLTRVFMIKMSPRMHFIFLLTSMSAIVIFRLIYRINRLIDNVSNEDVKDKKRMLIVGAGESTALLLREMYKYSRNKYRPVAIADDDNEKIGRKILGIKVEGSTDQIPELCEKFDIEVILFSISSISLAQRRRILDICAKTNLEVRIIPNMYEVLTSGTSLNSAIRKIKVEDLLGREPIIFDKNKYGGYVQQKTVLVTGGGGSIGSELCRQIAELGCKRLIILDVYENNAYDIQQELKMKYGNDLNLSVEIATICDKKELEDIFIKENIDVVFHAAAHKHVPLMEKNPEEAVKNNVFGTLNLIECSHKFKVKKFVQISTDKAVNPTNVMGATKRICEMLVQMENMKSSTEFVAVRFGNVLGSNGSVIPLFEEQIKKMGPVTVTHPDIIRYFMTIPEAVSLVLTAGGIAKGGEIFILDMGDPVKIKDLAENLIRLSGYTPGEDIKIEYTGLRPGEKLYEELLMDEEGIQKTKSRKIYIGKPISLDENRLTQDLEELKSICNKGSKEEIIQMLLKIVPTFKTNIVK
ncbi:MAG: nucleoside-diphosphate sugar epimerase/dehydratase [Clostridia bacterium]|nr:nucleoside-diphosphate sugar epimerase/dehydratase [Clostridia bacterium]